MNRRDFLRRGARLGAGAGLPALLGPTAAARPLADAADFRVPTVLPQVVNVFLHGGPSALGGDLVGLGAVAHDPRGPYPAALGRPVADGGQLTRHGFWADAGGHAMEDMLAAGDLSVYRTVHRRGGDVPAHRPAVLSALSGSLAVDVAPGMGTTLAALLHAHRHALDGAPVLGGRPLDALVLPFVSLEGASAAFARGAGLETCLAAPRARPDLGAEIEAMAGRLAELARRAAPRRAAGAAGRRRAVEALVERLRAAARRPLPAPPPRPDGTPDPDADPVTGRLAYAPGDRFAARLGAAVTLVLENPDTLFVAVGGGLGGWDDHDAALEGYVPRLRRVMAALRVATKQIRGGDVARGGARRTDNIVVNVYGEFGRGLELGGSGGWDHGAAQTLYTLGGAALRPPGALGKVVGRTEIVGTARRGDRRLRPVDDGYAADPRAIAASVYGWFGARGPEALTRDAVRDPVGVGALDETLPPEPPAPL